MKIYLYILPAIILMASCSGHDNRPNSDASQMPDADIAVCSSIEGQWMLEHVAVSDSLEIRPLDINPDSKLYVHFYDDSTFNFQTGCNAIGGRYEQSGRSIVMSDMLWTEMACDDMQVEEMLRDVLPRVNSVEWKNDSIIRLDTPNTSYILLKQCEAKVKCNEP